MYWMVWQESTTSTAPLADTAAVQPGAAIVNELDLDAAAASAVERSTRRLQKNRPTATAVSHTAATEEPADTDWATHKTHRHLLAVLFSHSNSLCAISFTLLHPYFSLGFSVSLLSLLIHMPARKSSDSCAFTLWILIVTHFYCPLNLPFLFPIEILRTKMNFYSSQWIKMWGKSFRILLFLKRFHQ